MNPIGRCVLVGALAFAIVGCSSRDSPPTLNGTQWRLKSIQSMDSDQGTTLTPNPSKFTVKFGDDGQAAFRIECNQASSSWKAVPSDDAASGTLEFGPVNGTETKCPQPSLDEQVTKALPFVRGYLIKDGQPHMSLFADGGILTWKRV
jgi:hypothetical protein